VKKTLITTFALLAVVSCSNKDKNLFSNWQNSEENASLDLTQCKFDEACTLTSLDSITSPIGAPGSALDATITVSGSQKSGDFKINVTMDFMGEKITIPTLQTHYTKTSTQLKVCADEKNEEQCTIFK